MRICVRCGGDSRVYYVQYISFHISHMLHVSLCKFSHCMILNIDLGKSWPAYALNTYTTRAVTIEISSVTPSTYTTGALNSQTNSVTSLVRYCPHHPSLTNRTDTLTHTTVATSSSTDQSKKDTNSQTPTHDRTYTT